MTGSDPKVEVDSAGTDTVKAAVAVFYHRVLADPQLAPWFEGVDVARLRAHQRAFLIVALGGPEIYTGRGLAEAHAGLAITPAAFDATVEHLMRSLRDAGMAAPMIRELRERVEGARGLIVAA